MTEKEKRDTRPYVVIKCTLTRHLEEMVAKYMGWGYGLHGDMILVTPNEFIQVMVRRDI